MTTIYILTVRDSDVPAITIHATAADAEATLRANYDQEPADYPHLTGDDLIAALEDRDDLEIAIFSTGLNLEPQLAAEDEDLYEALKDTAERFGWVGEYADDLLLMAAQAIADDPQNQEEAE